MYGSFLRNKIKVQKERHVGKTARDDNNKFTMARAYDVWDHLPPRPLIDVWW